MTRAIRSFVAMGRRGGAGPAIALAIEGGAWPAEAELLNLAVAQDLIRHGGG